MKNEPSRGDGVDAMPRRLNAVDAAARESTRLVNVRGSFATASFHAGGDPRLLTAILYLSGDVDGGRFRSYKATEDVVTAEVAPAPGTFVCFWSDRLVHDVSEVTRLDEARWALTVWLCTDDDIVEQTPESVLAAHWPHLRDS